MIDDGWMVGAAVSKLLIPGTEISLLLVSPRLFHMRDPSPCRLHLQSRERPRRKASDIWHRVRECIETAKKERHAVHYFIYTVQNISLPARKDITLAWGSMRMAECQEESGTGKWEVEATWDKRLSFPFLKRSNMTYRGHERDDEKGHRKEIWRRTETKGKQAELIWLPVPICKVFNTHENFFVTPLSLYPLFLNLSILRYTHHVAHLHLWSCFAMLNPFISTARGPSQAARTWRMGQGRGVWEGDWFIFKITQDAESWNWREIQPKTNQEDRQRGKRAQPADFGQHGTLLTQAHQLMQQCKN